MSNLKQKLINTIEFEWDNEMDECMPIKCDSIHIPTLEATKPSICSCYHQKHPSHILPGKAIFALYINVATSRIQRMNCHRTTVKLNLKATTATITNPFVVVFMAC